MLCGVFFGGKTTSHHSSLRSFRCTIYQKRSFRNLKMTNANMSNSGLRRQILKQHTEANHSHPHFINDAMPDQVPTTPGLESGPLKYPEERHKSLSQDDKKSAKEQAKEPKKKEPYALFSRGAVYSISFAVALAIWVAIIAMSMSLLYYSWPFSARPRPRPEGRTTR